ncbi:hypothetical protein [Niabella ginsengisoli]|uniref:Phosphatidate cytidylyltransferase n=1 Tax=Niabella ginsengisoli TaxID=522298 RepID=A0ABS9SM54_9BACT|nr:hypothetical protein [Niabella ginsengisoli]MCH5599410.1 hypothetical protein [Niabella ginsengisoli]
MKNLTLFFLVVFLSFTLQSCEVVEGIFKAGMWWAFFLIALVAVGLFLLFRKK